LLEPPVFSTVSEITSSALSETPGEPVSTRVVTAAAEAGDVSPTDLPPLYYVVDPEALDDLFRPESREPNSMRGCIEFTYAGCDVVVTADGRVSVTPRLSPDENEVDA